MPSIDTRTVQKLITTQRKYADVLARALVEQKLNELETALDHERQKRGLKPITNDDGTIIRWVRTRPQSPGER
jgi:hypothetical protein